jgi:Fe-S oxidoreductase
MNTPSIKEGSSAGQVSRRAKTDLMSSIGMPAELPPDWKPRVLKKLGGLLKERRCLQVMMDTCVRCGACADKCHYFLGTGDPANMPVARAGLLRKVYKRHFTLAGKFGAGAELDEKVLGQWFTYFYQCSQCRRCATFCPFGIDTAEITSAAREILAEAGMATKYVVEVVRKANEIGNNLGIPAEAWADSCKFLEDEMREETGRDIKIPVDQEGAEVLLVPPSADIFANTDTMIGYAKFFHAAGISWTTSTHASEAGNFGLFLNYEQLGKINRRLVDAARALKTRRLVIGECGHAWRVAQAFTDTINGPLDFLDPPRPEHILELVCRVLRRGGITLDKSANDSATVTYHDPCNLARASGLMEEPREILRAVAGNFREMPANTIREKTFCCGGGGGMLSEELMDLRMKGAGPRIEAFKASGANCLATPCAICKAQLQAAFGHYKIEAAVVGVMDLLGKAIALT